MKTLTLIAVRCTAGYALICLAIQAQTAIQIISATPNQVQPGQSLLVVLGVTNGNGTQAQVPCPLTLTPMGGTTPALTVPPLVGPPAAGTIQIPIPSTTPMGTYILRWTCANGISSTAPSPITIEAQPTIQSLSPSPSPSGSDQTIQGQWFGDTQGSGYIYIAKNVAGQGGFKVPNVLSWSNTAVQFTLPILEPGSYQVSVQTNDNGNSAYFPLQITAPSLQGWVDLHTHPMANLGFGGKLFYGWADADPNGASQDASNGGPCSPIPLTVNSIVLALGPDNWAFGGYSHPNNPCGDIVGYPFTSVRDQVIHTTEDANGALDPADSTYTTDGYPGFPTWPAWNEIMHQKMWVDWIRRAHNGGLSVLVALAVNNKTEGDMVSDPGDLPTDDMASGDIQIQQIKSFVGRNSDLMQVAYTAADLARIILSKKVAVVIGVELDNIGNLGVATNATRILTGGVSPAAGAGIGATFGGMLGGILGGPIGSLVGGALGAFAGTGVGATIGQVNTGANVAPVSACSLVSEVDRLHNEGVRYIFPIHLVDGPAGGTAINTDLFDTANVYEEGHAWNLTCAAGIGYIYNENNAATPSITSLVGIAEQLKLGFIVETPPPYACPTGQGNVNSAGLTPAGNAAIQEMMHKGMLIDIDHMSDVAAGQTIHLAQPQQPGGLGYPLNSGHNSVRQPGGSERSLSSAHYQAIGALHGMAGVGSVGVDACSWMNAYNAVVQAMGTNTAGPEVIAGFGTDQVMQAGMPPRLDVVQHPAAFTTCLNKCEEPLKFGACGAEAGGENSAGCEASKEQCSLQCNKSYPIQVIHPTCNGVSAPSNVVYDSSFPMSALGNQSWNYNSVGVAHYGMLPDFLRDVQSLPSPASASNLNGAAVVSQMMSGAQYFYESWRLAEKAAATKPAQTSCTMPVQTNPTGPSCQAPNRIVNCGSINRGQQLQCLAPLDSCQ
jgi:hypothetical protein